MWTEADKLIIQELNSTLHQPWNDYAERNMELFHALSTRQGGVTVLVSSSQAITSQRAISAISFLLTDVELYRKEINALYIWLAAVADQLDENSRGNLATAIQRHIAILSIQLPLDPDIEKVMIPFLLKSLTANVWTIRLSAVSSLDMLDGYCRLGKWLTKVQLAELRQNLKIHLALDEEQELSPSAIGRLKRFTKK